MASKNRKGPTGDFLNDIFNNPEGDAFLKTVFESLTQEPSQPVTNPKSDAQRLAEETGYSLDVATVAGDTKNQFGINAPTRDFLRRLMQNLGQVDKEARKKRLIEGIEKFALDNDKSPTTQKERATQRASMERLHQTLQDSTVEELEQFVRLLLGAVGQGPTKEFDEFVRWLSDTLEKET